MYAAIAQAFPLEGRVFVILSLGSFGANLEAIESLSSRVASMPMRSPARPTLRFRRNNETYESTGLAEELMKHQSTLHGESLAVSML